MECPKCQSQVNEGSKFCHICGTPLTGADTYTSGSGAETPEADNASAVNQYDGQHRKINNRNIRSRNFSSRKINNRNIRSRNFSSRNINSRNTGRVISRTARQATRSICSSISSFKTETAGM